MASPVSTTSARTSAARSDRDQVGDVNSSEVWVSIDSGADYDATLASIEDTVDRVRSARHDVVTYTTQKIRDVGALQRGREPGHAATASTC